MRRALNFILVTFILSIQVQANSGFKKPIFSKDFDFRKLNYLDQQKHIRIVRKFMLEVEQGYKLDNGKYTFMDLLNMNAVASGNMCFFGGWKSELVNGKCKVPWNYGSQKEYKQCNPSTNFRCNPTLFGTGADGGDGKGHCIKPKGGYNDVTQDCLNKSKAEGDIDKVIANAMANPKKFADTLQGINQFCSNIGADKAKLFACENLVKRVEDIEKQKAKRIKEGQEEAIARNKAQQRALGILDGCKKHYDDENSGFFAGLTKSDRDVVGGVLDNYCLKDYDLAHGADTVSFNSFKRELDGIESKVATGAMLKEMSLANFGNSVAALLANQIQYNGAPNKDQLVNQINRKFPNILKGKRFKDKLNELYAKFDDPKTKDAIKKGTPSKAEMVKGFKDFGKKLNAICKKVKKDRDNLSFWDRSLTDINTDEEDEIYNAAQAEINALVEGMVKKPYGSLINTPTFRDKIFPFNQDMAENCGEEESDIEGEDARGNTVQKLFRDGFNANDLELANSELKDMLYDDMKGVNDAVAAVRNNDQDAVNEEIEDILKYKPFLAGQLLRGAKGKGAETYAKFLCKKSLDIYDEDELWNAGELALGATALAVNFIPGVGQILSAGIRVGMAAGAVAFEATAAKRRYDDSLATEDGAAVGFATGQISTSRAAKEFLRAADQEAWAIFDGAMAVVGLGGISKGIKQARRAVKVSKMPVDDAKPVVMASQDGGTQVVKVTGVQGKGKKRTFEVTDTRTGKTEVVPVKDMQQRVVLEGEPITIQTSSGPVTEDFQVQLESHK